MSHVLTLVAPRPLSDGTIREALALLEVDTSPDRLGEEAVDVLLPSDEAVAGAQAAIPSLQDRGFDVAISATENRRKRLLIADMDSTIIEQECIDELAHQAGIGEEISEITEAAMRGELDFEQALRARVSRLKGLSLDVIEDLLGERIRLSRGAEILVKTMGHAGAITALVSGGFTHFTGPVAARAGFDHHFGNTLIVTNDGDLSGAVAPPVLGRAAKRDRLLALCDDYHAGPGDALALGDGANDLAMIETAGLGVAYRAKPVVAAAADAAIQHTDLTAALYFQGYRQEEFYRSTPAAL